ncbi:GLPGLI family protein [Flavobacterium macrobrachii]|uniref:GLPGLI family protein n=1 Tax=Flavobacterium macrobrachii TaxID=591204 RepID=UPI003F72E268
MKQIFFLLFTALMFSQVNSAAIEYKIFMSQEEDKTLSGDMKEYYKLAVDGSKNVTFILNYSDNLAEFIKMNALNSNDNINNLAQAFSGFLGNIYIDFNEGNSYQTYNDVLGNYVIKKEIKRYDWILTSETKIIEGFTCYKATAVDIVVNSAGTFSYPVTAWYSPQIPIKSGPLGITGLPGLILEISRRNIVFGATKIFINPENKPKIIKPKLDNLKTEEEINKMKFDFINSKD